jgi:hypothetical protein
MRREQAGERPVGLSRWAALRAGAGAGLALAASATGRLAHRTDAQTQATTIRWHLISQSGGDPAVDSFSPGGEASARAENGERLTIMGTGTFSPGAPRNVSGGGPYTIRSSDGAVMATGTYRVTEFVSWQEAPGGPSRFTDTIGVPADQRAGLVVLRIAYSDGNEGILVVSCNLFGAPAAIFEGIVGSRAYVFYWNHEVAQAAPWIDANRTIFHVVRGPAALPRTGEGDATGELPAEEEYRA